MVVLQRWCVLLEKHRCAEAPEALRLACAQALALTGAAVVSSSVMGSTVLKSLSTRCVCVAAFFSFSQFIYIFMPKKFFFFFFLNVQYSSLAFYGCLHSFPNGSDFWIEQAGQKLAVNPRFIISVTLKSSALALALTAWYFELTLFIRSLVSLSGF